MEENIQKRLRKQEQLEDENEEIQLFKNLYNSLNKLLQSFKEKGKEKEKEAVEEQIKAVKRLWQIQKEREEEDDDEEKTKKEILREIKELKEEIKKEIKEEIQSLTQKTQKTQSWAQITQLPKSYMQQPQSQQQAKNRTIQYRVEKSQLEETQKLTPQELIKKIQKNGKEWAHIVAAKTTKTGFQIVTSSQGEKEKIEKENRTPLPQSQIIQKGYPILVHGIQKQEITKSLLTEIEIINKKIYSFKIQSARWLSKNKEKTRGTIILNLDSEKAAKVLIQEGLIYNAQILLTEQWENSWELTQCYKCQGYNHIARNCKKEKDSCGYCGEEHRLENCKKEKQKCNNCQGNHTAFSKTCIKRQQVIQKIQDKRQQGARYMQNNFQDNLTNQSYKLAQTEWEIVEKRKGRPVGAINKIKTIPREKSQSQLGVTTRRQATQERQEESSENEI